MKILKKLFYFVWSLWAIFIWISTLIISCLGYAIIFLIGGKNADKAGLKLSRIWAKVGLFLSGIIVKVHSRENINPNQNYIFISNHRSQLDIPICAVGTPNYFKFLAKEELVKIPFLGYIIKRLYITVKRDNVRDRVKSFQKMRKEVENNTSIWLYPEGTRNRTDLPLNTFQDGAFRLAIDTATPIAMMVIIDSGKNLPAGTFFQFKPGIVHFYCLPPINTVGMKGAEANALKEKAYNEMYAFIKEKRAFHS